MNQVRTFRADSMQEALAAVRQELGTDAVIVDTQETSRKRLLPWLRAKTEVVVSAHAGLPASGFDGQQSGLPYDAVDVSSSDVLSGFNDGSPEPDNPIARASQIAAELERTRSSLPELEHQTWASPPRSDRTEATSESAPAEAAQESDSETTAELTSRLDTLQKMVENLTRSAHLHGGDEIPPELFEIYTHLIDADVEDELARGLIASLKSSSTPEQLSNPMASRAILSGMVEADLRCSPPIAPETGRRRIVALVGPTGVGKTTTIAKLAANFRLRDGIRMGLVTVDTYRIAAVEQLRTYAEIIDLPMKVVTSPQEMRRALDELAGLDLILIDTAGRGPRDELKIQELKSMLNEAVVDEIHLVVSLTASVRSIQMTCDQFRPINPTALVLTKLDEAAGMGSMLSVSRQVQLPISYLTTGQDVPEDIEPANASRIARLVLGQDRLFD